MRNLTVVVDFDKSNNEILANLSWIGPETPYGKIDHYEIVVISPKVARLIHRNWSVKVCDQTQFHY